MCEFYSRLQMEVKVMWFLLSDFRCPELTSVWYTGVQHIDSLDIQEEKTANGVHSVYYLRKQGRDGRATEIYC